MPDSIDLPTDSVGDAQYRLLFERNPNPMMVFDVATLCFLAANRAARRKYGYSRKEFLSMTVRALHPPEDARSLDALDMSSPGTIRMPTVHVTKSGNILNVDIESEVMTLGGVPARLVLAVDTTDRRRAEAAARAGAERYRDLFEHVPVGLYVTSAAGVCLDVNPVFHHMMGYDTCEEMLAVDPDSYYVDPAERRRWHQEIMSTGGVRDFEMQLRRKDGETIWVRHTASARYDAQGMVLYYEGAIQDITEQRNLETEKSLRAAILEAQTEASLDAILVVDSAGRIVTYNTQFIEMWGIPKEILKPGSDRSTLQAFEPQVRDSVAFRRRIEYLYAHPSERSREEIAMADGRCIDRYSAPIQAPDGSYYGRVWYFRDVTAHQQLEAQLLQASKMEAIGQLAGGVAHDFNNILTAIQGQALLILEESDLPPTVKQDVREIEANARRAADLTRQLLAFSRQQILQARVIDLSHVVDGVFPMLRRLIGSHVTLTSEARPELWNVRADPNQIERIILNLAVNAEQAMHTGGTLKISLRNAVLDADTGAGLAYEVKPGQYVRLSVSDTGEGMDEATIARIFEPFFTTKLQGRGTGLGLSTVYGVVKQSGGYIWVESTPGAGTTFSIYLPAVDESVTKPVRPVVSLERDTGHGETIMVCEDEEPVRLLVKRVLEKSGYRVLAAADPREALNIARAYDEPIHLLLTDIVMPGMGGRELARQIKIMRPGIRTVLMSGYSDADLVWNDEPGDATPFLQKPFTPTSLTRFVSAALQSVSPT